MLHVVQGSTFAAPSVCGFWDADLSAPIAEIPLVASVFDREPAIQWVWAIRLRALGRSVTRGNLRHYLGRAFATATSTMLGIGVYDTQCGAKLFRVNELLREVLSEPFVSRWVFDVELLSRADAMLRAGGAPGVTEIVYEQPLGHWHHVAGSKVRPADFARAALDLLRIYRNRRQWSRPIRGASAAAPARGMVHEG
jgi:dolichyl-phosphate beta-glucosyltransferase